MGLCCLAVSVTGAAIADAPLVDFTKFAPWSPGADEGDYVLNPPYADALELTLKDNVPKEMAYQFTMNSTESIIYPGISKTAPDQVVPYQRRVTVYVSNQ